MFKGLFRAITLLLKKGLVSVGRSVLDAGSRTLKYVSESDTSIRDALKGEVIHTFYPRNLINRITNKRKATSQPAHSRSKVARKATVTTQKRISDAPRFSKKKETP